MYFETIKNMLCDEVAETVAALSSDQVIEYSGRLYGIPRTIIHSGYDCVMGWRKGILHGIRGDVDILTTDGATCGQMSVWALDEVLSGNEFVIRSAVQDEKDPIIRNVADLATYLDTTVEGIPDNVRTYHDYPTTVKLYDHGIILETVAGETGKTNGKELLYPFSGATYEDAHVGLQCWADATYWDAVHNGEV